MKFIHPFIEPEFTSFSGHAGIFTVLSGKIDDNIKLWFIHNYIELQCRFSYNNRIILFDDEFAENDILNCPFFDRYVVPREHVQQWGGVVPYLKNQIALGYYVYLSLDRFHNPHFKETYKKIHFNHLSLFLGFDDDNEIFYVADFYEKYSCKTVSYNDVNNGFLSYDFDKELNPYGYIMSIQYNEVMVEPYYYRPSIIRYLLSSYIVGNKRDDIWFGKYAYDVAIESIKNNIFQYRIFHILYDHKKAMHLRVKYLQELGLVQFTSKEINLFQQLENEGLICRNMVLKVSINPDEKYKEKVIQRYMKLAENEEPCIYLLYNKLEEPMLKKNDRINSSKI